MVQAHRASVVGDAKGGGEGYEEGMGKEARAGKAWLGGRQMLSMTTPGVELGLPWPQHDALATRLCSPRARS